MSTNRPLMQTEDAIERQLIVMHNKAARIKTGLQSFQEKAYECFDEKKADRRCAQYINLGESFQMRLDLVTAQYERYKQNPDEALLEKINRNLEKLNQNRHSIVMLERSMKQQKKEHHKAEKENTETSHEFSSGTMVINEPIDSGTLYNLPSVISKVSSDTKDFMNERNYQREFALCKAKMMESGVTEREKLQAQKKMIDLNYNKIKNHTYSNPIDKATDLIQNIQDKLNYTIQRAAYYHKNDLAKEASDLLKEIEKINKNETMTPLEKLKNIEKKLDQSDLKKYEKDENASSYVKNIISDFKSCCAIVTEQCAEKRKILEKEFNQNAAELNVKYTLPKQGVRPSEVLQQGVTLFEKNIALCEKLKEYAANQTEKQKDNKKLDSMMATKEMMQKKMDVLQKDTKNNIPIKENNMALRDLLSAASRAGSMAERTLQSEQKQQPENRAPRRR